jgi:hypothetical protein
VTAESSTGVEYGTDRPYEIGCIVYVVGVRSYVALAFRYTDGPSEWELTWIGEEGENAARLPAGVKPSAEMLSALNSAQPAAAA